MSDMPTLVKIMTIGVGGGGCNAVNRMVSAEIAEVDFAGLNTDAQALMLCEAPIRLQIGEAATRGLGVGGDPAFGLAAAEESRDRLAELVSGKDMVFIAAGMGGGTGTGAAPLVAELARQAGALTIGIVSQPFSFEGVRRQQVAEEGVKKLTDKVDAMIVIMNDRLFELPNFDYRVTVDNAFKTVDDVLMTGVRAIVEVVTLPGLINLDFADVKAVMKDAGPTWLSLGQSSCQGRAVEAARQAIRSPLLATDIKGAKGVLFTITGSSSLTLSEVNQAAEVIRNEVDPEANVIFGVTLDSRMDNEIRLVLVATGYTPSRTVASKQRDQEFRRILKGLDETEMDMPAFMRRPLTLRRRIDRKT